MGHEIMRRRQYISEQFLNELIYTQSSISIGGAGKDAVNVEESSSFTNFSFSKLLLLLGIKLLPPSVSNLVNAGLLFSGTIRYDITNIIADLLSVLRQAAEKYIRGRTWRCSLKTSPIDKAICLRNAYDDVIRELEKRKKMCDKTRNKQDCIEYINKLQQKWRDRKEELVHTNT